MSVDLVKILLASGRVKGRQIEEAMARARETGTSLESSLLYNDAVTEDGLADALGAHFEIPGLSLARLPRPDPRVVRLVPEKLARGKQVVPLEKAGGTLMLLMADPADIQAVNLVREASGLEVQPLVGSLETVAHALDTFFPDEASKLLSSVLPFVGKLLTEEAARSCRALPVDRNGNLVTVAIAGTDIEKTKRAIELATGLQVRPIKARWEDVERAIARLHSAPDDAPQPAARPAGAPAVPATTTPLTAASARGPAAPASPRPAPAAARTSTSAGESLSLEGLLGPPKQTAPAAASATSPPAMPGPPNAGPPGDGKLALSDLMTEAAPAPSAPTSPAPKPAAPPTAAPTTATMAAESSAPGARETATSGGDGVLSLDELSAAAATPQADAGDPAGPNLGPAGQEGGPRTGLKVEATDRGKMASIVSDTWGDLDLRLAKVIPEKLARQYRTVPTGRLDKTIYVAMEDPNDTFAIEAIEFVTGLRAEVTAATPDAITAGLEILYVPEEDAIAAIMDELGDIDLDDVQTREELAALNDLDASQAAEAAPIVRLVNKVIDQALRARAASDIHFEVYEEGLRIRYRIDGVLREVMKPPLQLRDALTSRLKILAKMDITERRLPQDGRMRIRRTEGKSVKYIDFRIASVPTIHGERILMRILDRDNVKLDLTDLGMEQQPLERFKEAVHKPYGMALVVGPSGSGKTNTLYSALADVNAPDVNIMTCEDPVEFATPGLNQVQARESIGLTFAAALRSFLRQDPNVILVGEIRDFETAEIAVKAALTGHMVLSTLHTNDAPSCINRLTNMGVEPFLIGSSLHLVVAQRLVRRICEHCRAHDTEVNRDFLIQLGFSPEKASTIEPVKGNGCPSCDYTGYMGRTGIFEVLEVSNEMREMILYNGSQMEIRELARRQGMRTLRESGLSKIELGITTCAEVVRETIA